MMRNFNVKNAVDVRLNASERNGEICWNKSVWKFEWSRCGATMKKRSFLLHHLCQQLFSREIRFPSIIGALTVTSSQTEWNVSALKPIKSCFLKFALCTLAVAWSCFFFAAAAALPGPPEPSEKSAKKRKERVTASGMLVAPPFTV